MSITLHHLKRENLTYGNVQKIFSKAANKAIQENNQRGLDKINGGVNGGVEDWPGLAR